jgi:hypothetical protein
VITISTTWWALVFIAGLIAIVIAATHEGVKSSPFWWYLSYWLAALALLSPFR